MAIFGAMTGVDIVKKFRVLLTLVIPGTLTTWRRRAVIALLPLKTDTCAGKPRGRETKLQGNLARDLKGNFSTCCFQCVKTVRVLSGYWHVGLQ